MPIQPLIAFKAGQCELREDKSVHPDPTKGFIYLYFSEDEEMVYFCWVPRDTPLDEPTTALLMIPGDPSFQPYTGPEGGSDSDNLHSPTDGRVFVLKFASSSERHLFYLQSKSQHPKGDPSWFSPRDLKLGQIVDALINNETVDVAAELREVASPGNGGGPDEDETMEDVEGTNHDINRNRTGSTGGAGPGATGGDIREEGEEAREGGADGGRAAAAGNTDASAVIQNFINSLKGGKVGGAASSQSELFANLLDLLSPATTIPFIDKAPDAVVDALCSHLPPMILLLAQEIDDLAEVDPTSETAQAAIEALTIEQKKDILKRVLRSPQMRQSLGSLTVAIRDGGLPNISSALKIKVENGGYMRGGAMPLGGGDAVRAFLDGVKTTVQEELEGDDKMETD